MSGNRFRIRDRRVNSFLLAIVTAIAIAAAVIFANQFLESKPPAASPGGGECPTTTAAGGSFRLQMNTESPNCYILNPPANSFTRFVWETLNGNVSLEVTQICLPSAGLCNALILDRNIYNSSGSFGSGNLSNYSGLAFEISVWSPPWDYQGSLNESRVSNVTVLVTGSWA
jgi:hypothetical protein